MRSVFVVSKCAGLILFAAAAAAPLVAASQPQKVVPEKYLPIHATVSIRGRCLYDDICPPHGFIIFWEGDLEPIDDDPDGILPAARYEADGPFSALKFDDFTCTGDPPCRNIVKRGPNPSGVARLSLMRETWDGKLERSVRFELSGFEVGYLIDCVTAETGGEPLGLDFDIAWDPENTSPPIALTPEDFERGFQRSFQRTDQESASQFVVYCEASGEVTVTLSYKQDTEKPKVEIAGCAHLLPGASEQLTATGTPSGGRYRWSAEPQSVLSVSGAESGASAQAGSPGHATVRVEYTARNGKKAEATLPGSVVTLASVNGGAAIPPIYLYDAYGNSTPPIVAPIEQDPPDGELLTFVVADPAIATVSNTGSSIVIQGVSEGTTTAQAWTKCSETTGPVITIQVAGCDPESVEKLKRRYKEVKQELDASVARVNKVLSSEKFTQASDGIKGAVIDVAVEAAETASGGAAKLAKATEAVKVAAKIIEVGAKGWDAYSEGMDAVLVKTAIETLVPGGEAAVSTYDKVTAVARLLKYTEALVDADERIAREQPIIDGYMKELEQIDKLIEKCKRGGKPGGPEPPAPKPGPTPPKPPAPPKDQPGGKKPGPGDPSTPPQPGEPPAPGEPGEPGGGEKPPPDEPPPPPPKSGGGTAGLPIDCGCPEASTTAWRNEKTGLAAIAASLSLLQGCAENYAADLKQFQADSASITNALRAIGAALEVEGERGFEQFRAAAPGLEAAERSYETLTKASEDFARTLKGCDTKVPEAVEIMRTAVPPEAAAAGAKSK